MELDRPTGKLTRVYKMADGLPIKVDVHLPGPGKDGEQAGGGPRPAVLYFHGGALIWGMRNRVMDEYVERCGKDGFILVSADYRLAPETKLRDIALDVEDALAWARGPGAVEFGIDPERVVAMGSSAGAYLALLSGTFAEPPRAVASLYGYGDILGDWYTRPSEAYLRRPLVGRKKAMQHIWHEPVSEGSDPRFLFYLWCRQRGRWVQEVTGMDPEADRNELLQYCPAHNVGPGYPPTILLHGDADTDVPVDQSRQMAAALETAGRPHELVIVESDGHGFDFETHQPKVQAAVDRMMAFLVERVG
jgi:acetyl esterase/lipase